METVSIAKTQKKTWQVRSNIQANVHLLLNVKAVIKKEFIPQGWVECGLTCHLSCITTMHQLIFIDCEQIFAF
ncbi:hypothetical protein PR048_012312 [Dryococelus australis]|uniref:Uncharacterized protein n=1 Tax=Dryococelus australis TaxID=614101 RepID=A0ABQ9HQA7_9NEOP|nr:hypothetical protein PR048_012312 [Dryococelus australis]